MEGRKMEERITVYITKKQHIKYEYLMNWTDPESGIGFGDWFRSLKELKEYTASWNCEYINVNF